MGVTGRLLGPCLVVLLAVARVGAECVGRTLAACVSTRVPVEAVLREEELTAANVSGSAWTALGRGGPTGCAEAFVTLLTSDDYLPGLVALVHSFRLHTAPAEDRDVVVLVTEDVAESTLDVLRALCVVLLRVPHIPNPYARSAGNASPALRGPAVQSADFDRFRHLYAKLWLWSLEQYRLLVYADADQLVLRSYVPLFKLRPFAAPHQRPGVSDRFATGTMVLRPSKATLRAMVAEVGSTLSFDGADMGFLNAFFRAHPGLGGEDTRAVPLGGSLSALSHASSTPVDPTGRSTVIPSHAILWRRSLVQEPALWDPDRVLGVDCSGPLVEKPWSSSWLTSAREYFLLYEAWWSVRSEVVFDAFGVPRPGRIRDYRWEVLVQRLEARRLTLPRALRRRFEVDACLSEPAQPPRSAETSSPPRCPFPARAGCWSPLEAFRASEWVSTDSFSVCGSGP